MKYFNLLLIALGVFFIACSNPEMMKTFPTEMVKATAVESQYFFIASEKDSIIIGNDGTGLVVGAQGRVEFKGSKKNTTNDPGALAAKVIEEYDKKRRVYTSTTFGSN